MNWGTTSNTSKTIEVDHVADEKPSQCFILHVLKSIVKNIDYFDNRRKYIANFTVGAIIFN